MSQLSSEFRNSRLWAFMEGGGLDGIILGDSGYPQNRWLYTPVPNPRDAADSAYNVAHRRTRCYVEQAFGILKARFRVLHSECRLQPEKLCKVATACAVLHNIATDDRIEMEPEEFDEDDDNPTAPEAFTQHINERRDYIVRFFAN